MLEFVEFKAGKTIRLDLHALPIGDTFAHKLTGDDLYRKLVELKVPNISTSMGWQQLALTYARWRRATTPHPLTGKLPDEAA
jgi:hypothetical protein